MTSRPAESLHWYDREGNPAYTVIAKNGNERPATLRDARKLELVPSVTTVAKEAAKPGLEGWKQRQVLLAALTLPRVGGETDDEWTDRIMEDSRQHASQAAALGTAVHAAVQRYYDCEIVVEEYARHIGAAIDALLAWRPGVAWATERSFAHPLGFGGKVDVHCAGEVVDFKTKEFSADDDLRTWEEQHMQLAAYRKGLRLPAAACAILYISVSHPGQAQLIEIEEAELQRGWAMFESLLGYWKAKKKFDPSFEGGRECLADKEHLSVGE